MAKFFLCGRKDYESAQTLAKKNSSRSFKETKEGEKGKEAEEIARGTVEEEEEEETSAVEIEKNGEAVRDPQCNPGEGEAEEGGEIRKKEVERKGDSRSDTERERENKVEGETEKIQSAASSSSLILRHGPRKPTS